MENAKVSCPTLAASQSAIDFMVNVRSENARITKEIYLDIAAMKNISLD